MTAIECAERQAAIERSQHDLQQQMADALAGCIEHCEWSTKQGQQAFQNAIDALSAFRAKEQP